MKIDLAPLAGQTERYILVAAWSVGADAQGVPADVQAANRMPPIGYKQRIALQADGSRGRPRSLQCVARTLKLNLQVQDTAACLARANGSWCCRPQAPGRPIGKPSPARAPRMGRCARGLRRRREWFRAVWTNGRRQCRSPAHACRSSARAPCSGVIDIAQLCGTPRCDRVGSRAVHRTTRSMSDVHAARGAIVVTVEQPGRVQAGACRLHLARGR